MPNRYYSNGKLLITGEYTVLDGALSFALPTKYGQFLTVSEIAEPVILWKSLDEKNRTWFEATFNLNDIFHLKEEEKYFSEGILKDNIKLHSTLYNILTEARKLNPDFLNATSGYKVETKLTFPKYWGLGSSSTLINNIAQWAKVDAFKLLWNSFSGSGYDIACAQNNFPVTYRLKDRIPEVNKVTFNPPFKENLFFVYLNKKQDSREGIASYKSVVKQKQKLIEEVSNITAELIKCQSLQNFETLINLHETLIADFLETPKVKDKFFPDYFGSVKSLGAWGGDFILATGNQTTPAYFKEKGYEVVISYDNMILS
ncbi:GYDIA family GHMP kinase [Abyssalbus ytuae]|uniref:GYDIA family GHMP kinase n=1 Tax=Abyssalbus ytuae TaxID=2926907 RepID=A0A9E6ZQN6_9FLAO|nr:GYDIA family GHMP kinase [Abyssalbus ytuae]UOB18725.1 GYDIA family GHMP kinase [Abyssalbus ytuae]